VSPLQPGGEYLVFASAIPPKSIRSTGELFGGSRSVRKQLLGTDGVMGFALLAEPLRRRYATLSVWRDDAALEAFGRSLPHRQLMTDLAEHMAPTTFVKWTMRGTDPRPTWHEALERLNRSDA
jgi:heme-degrading monooxygenase HmoA